MQNEDSTLKIGVNHLRYKATNKCLTVAVL